MRTRVKVCCIASVEEARLAIDAGADALGFIGVVPSPRTLADTRIADIVATVPPPVATFLLTAERTADAIADHVQRTGATTVQMVAHVDPAESARLADLAPRVRRVQVIHVEGPAALDLLPAYTPFVHAFVLDSGRPNAATPEFGGTGRQHDWTVSAGIVQASHLPVFLAGGLSATNAADAIRQVRPFGLDACSGVRTAGHLDPEKLSAFMSAVQQTDEDPIPPRHLTIAFAPGSALDREQDRPSQLPIVRNGPPGTFVRLDGVRISLPTDLIVEADERNGAVVVGFGGMQFSGVQAGRITCVRVRDLWPEHRLSPARSWTMTLDPLWVTSVHENGRQVWPPTAQS